MTISKYYQNLSLLDLASQTHDSAKISFDITLHCLLKLSCIKDYHFSIPHKPLPKQIQPQVETVHSMGISSVFLASSKF